MHCITTIILNGTIFTFTDNGITYYKILITSDSFIVLFKNELTPQIINDISIIINAKLNGRTLVSNTIPFWASNNIEISIRQEFKKNIFKLGDYHFSKLAVCCETVALQENIIEIKDNISIMTNIINEEYIELCVFINSVIPVLNLILSKTEEVYTVTNVNVIDGVVCYEYYDLIMKKIIEKLFNISNISVIYGHTSLFFTNNSHFTIKRYN